MKKYILSAVIFISMISAFGFNNNNLTASLRFATVEKARELLRTEDQFTNNMSQFDINARLQKNKSSKQDYLEFTSSQALDWTQAEKDKITSIIKDIELNLSINKFRINLPDEIYFVKTSAKDEASSNGYSRANYIVLKDFTFQLQDFDLKQKILQELFHVIERFDSGFRINMYKIIGFKIVNEINYPDSIKEYKITFPDAPLTDNYITLKKDGKLIDCMMINYSKTNYIGGFISGYLNFYLLKLKDPTNGEIEYADGKPVIYSIKEIPNYMEQVGKNTRRITNPEFILADNFALAVINKKGLPSQWIVDKIQEILKE